MRPYVDCLLQTVRGRIPTFVGTTALGGHEIARRIRFVKERGATGTLLGIPMWQPATLDMAVQFYASVAETFPDFPIMVYANPRAFRFAFGVDFWKPIVDKAPTVMSAKFSSKAYPPRISGRDQRAVSTSFPRSVSPTSSLSYPRKRRPHVGFPQSDRNRPSRS